MKITFEIKEKARKTTEDLDKMTKEEKLVLIQQAISKGFSVPESHVSVISLEEEPFYLRGSMKFNGKVYKTLTFGINGVSITPHWVTVAPYSLFDDMESSSQFADRERIDNGIFYYVQDEVIKKEDIKDILKNHLDMEYEVWNG